MYNGMSSMREKVIVTLRQNNQTIHGLIASYMNLNAFYPTPSNSIRRHTTKIGGYDTRCDFPSNMSHSTFFPIVCRGHIIKRNCHCDACTKQLYNSCVTIRNKLSLVTLYRHPPLAESRNFRNEALSHIALIFCILRA